MSETWITHFIESDSSSTGVAVNMRSIHKIRTFTRNQGLQRIYVIAFDRSTDARENATTWSFGTRDSALSALAQVVCAIAGLSFVDDYQKIVEHKTFIDLAKGFEKEKAA